MDRLARNLDDVRSLLTKVTTTGVRIEFLASCGGPAGFRRRKDSCDVVITGEGSIHEQRLAGKLRAAVARRSGTLPIIAVDGRCGSLERTLSLIRNSGNTAISIDHNQEVAGTF